MPVGVVHRSCAGSGRIPAAKAKARLASVLLWSILAVARLHAVAESVTAVDIGNRSVTIHALGKPSLSTFAFARDSERFFVVSLDNAVLLGRPGVLRFPALPSSTVTAAQFSVDPDVVHVVVQGRFTNAPTVSLRSQGGDRYLVTLALRERPRFKVFLDVGHGGYDPGGTGPDGLPESFVNLSVAKRLAEILRGEGIEVAFDRTEDTYVSLPERVALANRSAADLFLGLYCNASSDPEIHGTTTYYYHSGSHDFARYLENEVSQSLGLANDGVMRDNLYVIRHTTPRMPDVLIEYAYISNRREEHLLATPAFRDRIASSIAQAIIRYFLRGSSPAGPEGAAQITSVETDDGALEIYSLGEPALDSFVFAQNKARFFVVTLRDAVLDGSARTFQLPPPFSAGVTVTQFTLNPDVVHLAIREDYPNSYRIDTQALSGGRFLTTIYPTEN